MKQKVACALLDIGAIGFNLKNPIRFKSGILGPVYIDNRILTSHPKQWTLIIQAFQDLIKKEKINFDVIAGIEAAGISHSSALGFASQKPSVFVRKQVKDHGTKKMVEGGDVKNKTVLLIEDHVSTGGSSLAGVNNLREAGAIVKDCFAITNWDVEEFNNSFKKAKVTLHTLADFSTILNEALKRKILSKKEVDVAKDWFKDPRGWEKRNGYV